MGERWTPPLRLHECEGGGCRLVLVSLACGRGSTLQEAADDLVLNVLNVIAATRASGLQIPGELGACDVRMPNFLHEVGEIAARGKDIRDRLFGLPTTRESPRSGGTRPSAAD